MTLVLRVSDSTHDIQAALEVVLFASHRQTVELFVVNFYPEDPVPSLVVWLSLLLLHGLRRLGSSLRLLRRRVMVMRRLGASLVASLGLGDSLLARGCNLILPSILARSLALGELVLSIGLGDSLMARGCILILM